MSSSEKIELQRDFTAGVYLSEAQNPIPPPLSHTVYVYTGYLFTHRREGGGGGESQPERRLEGQQFTMLGRKYQHGYKL